MPMTTGQVVTDNTAITTLCTVPAGTATVLISNAGPATAVVGPGPGPLTGNGHFIFPGAAPTYWASPASSRGGTLVTSVTVNGQTATVSYMVCT